MYRKLYSSIRQQLTGISLIIGLVFLATLSAQAQHRTNQGLTYGGGGSDNPGDGFGVAINGGYDMPSGDLGKVYKSAPTFGFSLVDNFGDLTLSATVNLVTYKPKIDTVYYYAANQTIGSIAYADNKIMEYYLGASYNIQVDDGLKFYIGANVGIYSDKVAFHTQDVYEDTQFSKTYNELYYAPKLGFTFAVDDNFSVSPGARYNFFKPSGNNNQYVTSNKSLTLGVTLMYIF